MAKFFSTIFYTLLIGLIVGAAAMLLGSKLAFPGSVEMKIVKSGSMEPAIPTGSVVIVKPSAEYRLDDVITFGKDTKTEVPTTHRIIALNADGTFTVKGDANEEQDQSPVAKRDVIGKVVFHVPYAGFLLDFARQPLGFALLIAVPAALIILEELLTIGRETRKWWRGGGKRGENGRNDFGGDASESLGAHLKMIYVKRRKMDEIFVPRVIERSRLARFLHADAYGTSTALVIGLVFASSLFSGASGGTVAYFQDIERSVGNIFAAASCDAFRLGSCVPIEPEEIIAETALFVEEEPEGEVAGASDENTEEPEEEASPSGGGGGGGGGGSTSTPEEPAPEPEQTPPTEETTPPAPETIPETEQTPESTPEEGEETPADAPPAETPPEQEAEPTPEPADPGTPSVE